MYAADAFRVDEPARIAAFAAAHPLATLCVNGPDGPVAAHAPLAPVLADDGGLAALVGHVARANPFWRAAQAGAVAVLAVFRGADAYVSPSAYPSKAEHGRVVPTWNYLAAEVRGLLTVETDPARMDPYLRLPTGMMEADRARPWAVDDAPADYLAAMARGAVGLRIEVTAAAAIAKLSQNKDAADRAGVVADLQTRADPAARALADLMQAERMMS